MSNITMRAELLAGVTIKGAIEEASKLARKYDDYIKIQGQDEGEKYLIAPSITKK